MVEGLRRAGKHRLCALRGCISPLQAAQVSTLPFKDLNALRTFWENLTFILKSHSFQNKLSFSHESLNVQCVYQGTTYTLCTVLSQTQSLAGNNQKLTSCGSASWLHRM